MVFTIQTLPQPQSPPKKIVRFNNNIKYNRDHHDNNHVRKAAQNIRILLIKSRKTPKTYLRAQQPVQESA